MSVLFLLLSRL